MTERTALRRTASGVAVATAGASAMGAGAAVGAAAYFARRVLTPESQRPDDVSILAVTDDSVTLGLTDETVADGRYGLWVDHGEGHLRVGRIIGVDQEVALVTRELEGVDRGRLRAGFARWNPYYYADSPDVSLGLPTQAVEVGTELGPMPAWLVQAESESDRWAVLVHGRGAIRQEALRAVPSLWATGWNSLVPTYRNDIGAPAGPDGRYNLGLSEWKDIEASVRYAVHRGARDVALVGWSMGGAIILQMLDRSSLSDVVSRVVLDSPVIDWNDVLAFHARANGVPGPIAELSRSMMGRRWARRLVGVHDPVDVAKTNWVARAAELEHPMLLIHSRDDEFVPYQPSERLAKARPDLVQLEPWETARHCQEWNLDRDRWEHLVSTFLR